MNDMASQRSALTAAQLQRGEIIQLLHDKLFDIDDALLVASAADGRALRRLTLQDVVLSAGMSEPRWREVRMRMLGALGRDYPTRQLTVGWLLDPRAGGRRHYAFHDALRSRTEPPTPGFPWHG